MTERLRISIQYENGLEQAVERICDTVTLDIELYEWLKTAFQGIGFNQDSVERFFEPVAAMEDV